MVFRNLLVIGIFFANALLPVTATYGLPRSNHAPTRVRSLQFIETPYSIGKKSVSYSSSEDNDYAARRDDKVYVITVDRNSPLLKQLVKLPLQNNDDSSEAELPENKLVMLPLQNNEDSAEAMPEKELMLPLQKHFDSFGPGLPEKKLVMLPLVNNESSDENDYRTKSRLSNDRWGKLFDKNGMIYLNPKERVKSGMRSDTTHTPGWDQLNKLLNERLIGRMMKPNPEPQVYRFSDLVL